MIELRDYQRAASDAACEALARSSRPLLAMPTGTGKTIVFADVCRRRREAGRSLVLVPRIELAKQAVEKILATTELTCGIEMGERRVDKGSLPDVTVASVQTMARERRREAFARDAFATIVVDECHHASSPSYGSILEWFDGVPCVGVTATPDRGDGIGLDAVFTSIAFSYELPEAIRDGWLAPITAKLVHLRDLDLAGVRTVAGDFNERQLADAVDPLLDSIAAGVLELRGERPTVVFCVTVDHADRMARLLNARAGREVARHVSGEMRMDERERNLLEFQRGSLPILTNVAVLTEGWDAPRCACIALARPTKSRALYTQMAGRGTRLSPETGKTDLLLLDFVGNAGKHSLIGPLDLMGIVIESGAGAEIAAALDGAGLGLIDGVEAANARARDAVKAMAKAQRTTREVDPMGKRGRDGRVWNRSAPAWDGPATEKQLVLLERAGIVIPNLTKRDASDRIDVVMSRRDAGLCTFRQAKILSQFGLPTDETAFVLAGQWIDAIKRNGWSLPNGLVVDTAA